MPASRTTRRFVAVVVAGAALAAAALFIDMTDGAPSKAEADSVWGAAPVGQVAGQPGTVTPNDSVWG